MSRIAAFFAMGGFAVYVWPAYGLAFAVLGGLALQSWRRYRASKSALDEIERPSRR
jgi:heme exporter protein D